VLIVGARGTEPTTERENGKKKKTAKTVWILQFIFIGKYGTRKRESFPRYFDANLSWLLGVRILN
jgi:hypothetical protein